MKLCVVVLNLLLLNHIAQSFVLLTANIEDIKKLAKKFVSESLAEKIADFIARATEQIITNVSEENDRNEREFQDISKENNEIYNIVRQGKQQEKPKQRFEKIRKEPPRKPFRTTRTTKRPIESRPRRPARVNLKNTVQKETHNFSKIKREPEKSFNKYNSKHNSEYPEEKPNPPKTTEIPHLDSTIGVAEVQGGKPKITAEDKKVPGPNIFRLTANSKENETIQPNDIENLENVLTTKRERNEFDQYDTVRQKISKVEYVATSGPVALPKLPSDDWWRDVNKNKPWL